MILADADYGDEADVRDGLTELGPLYAVGCAALLDRVGARRHTVASQGMEWGRGKPAKLLRCRPADEVTVDLDPGASALLQW